MSDIFNYCISFYSNKIKRTSGAAYTVVKAKDSFSFSLVERGCYNTKACEVCSLFKVSLQKLPPKSANLNSYYSLFTSGWFTKQFPGFMSSW